MSEQRGVRRGEIWLFEPDPTVGREQRGIRPGVVVSIDTLNQSSREVLIMVPLTTQQRPSEDYPFHVRVEPDDSGLNQVSYAMCEQIRVVSYSRIYGRRRQGFLSRHAIAELEDSLRILLDL